MDVKLFSQMVRDKNLQDLKKMQYKYSAEDVSEMIDFMKEFMYEQLPLKDFAGMPICYIESAGRVSMNVVKLLVMPQNNKEKYSIKAMEDEIHSTLQIENIDSSRDSIRRMLKGYSPANDDEKGIHGMKQGLDFISDTNNRITEENLYKLYTIAIGDYLEVENKLLTGMHYRHDEVYVVGNKVKHEGLPYEKLPSYMSNLIEFINTDTGMNELVKAAAIHFYFAYLHPYFDGNGRTARLAQMWYLVQAGYPSTMFVTFSKLINETRSKYYKAYQAIEENCKISGVLDITPFITYFIENIYNKLGEGLPCIDNLQALKQVFEDGKITEKEKELWGFVISAYGAEEFSTKQLERDFGNAAYATIRGFVIKFEELGLLRKAEYSNRPKYCIVSESKVVLAER